MDCRTSKGFTLIETLIAFIVLAVGLLGAVSLQMKAKKSNYDALQRTAAIGLANDIIQRMKTNDTAAAFVVYSQATFSSDTEVIGEHSSVCNNVRCTDVQTANYDIEQWKKSLRAKQRTGSLADATVCISTTNNDATAAVVDANIQVVIAWLGKNNVNNATDSDIVCGTTDVQRQMVMMESYVYGRV